MVTHLLPPKRPYPVGSVEDRLWCAGYKQGWLDARQGKTELQLEDRVQDLRTGAFGIVVGVGAHTCEILPDNSGDLQTVEFRHLVLVRH